MEPIQPDFPITDTGVSLTPPPDPTEDQVSLSGNTQQSLPIGLAQTRAAKIHEGLGKVLEMEKKDIELQVQGGYETDIRREAASKLDVVKAKAAHNALIKASKDAGDAPLNPTVFDGLMAERSKVTDPDTVVEEAYGKAFVDNSFEAATTNLPASPVSRAKQEITEAYDWLAVQAAMATTRIEYATTQKERIGLKVKEQPMGEFLWDQAANLFQPQVEYQMRGLNPNVGKISGGVLLGTNLQAQADDLVSPITTPSFDEFKVKLKSITEKLEETDPTLAYHFLEYVEGLGTADRYLDNFFTTIAIPDYLGIGKAGLAIARRISMANRTSTAMKQLVHEAATIEAKTQAGIDPVVSRAEVVGDVATAAEVRSTKIVEDTLAGRSDPIKMATDDSLTTNLKLDSDNLATDKGTLSREQVVRIQNQFQASAERIIKQITDAVRINRVPMAVATANAVRIIKESVKEYYPGIRNAILDISNPLYESRGNTYWHEITFGNFGGDLFSNAKTAKAFADLHGLQAEIVETTGRITPAATEKMLARKAKLEKDIKEAESSAELYGRQIKDKKTPAEEKPKLQEQITGLSSLRRGFEKELGDINLKLKSGSTFERVAHLEGETARLRAENKHGRSTAKKSKDADEVLAINKKIEENLAKIISNTQEAKAIREGKAEVVARPATIEQHGVGFKIVVRRPLVETDKAVRDLMIRDENGVLIRQATSTSSSTGLKSFFNGALRIGKWRSSEDTLALNESIQRAIGTYSQSLFKKWANEEVKYIKQLVTGVIRSDPVTGEKIPYWRAKPVAMWNRTTRSTKQEFDEWVRTVDYARDAPDPKTSKPGYFFQTPAELQNHYRTHFDRPPSFAEHEAYFAYVRLVEGDRIFREISEFRNRARLGTEQHQISFRGPDGKPIKSDYFDGVVRKVFPGGDDVLLILGKRAGEERIVNLGGAGINNKILEGYKKDVLEGRKKVIEIFAPEHTPLKGFSDIAGNDMVRFVLVDSIDSTKPIQFNHVNRRGGGHFEYDYDHYIKQAKMYHQYEMSANIKGRYRSVYTGDQTFMPVENRIMGADIAKKMNDGRLLLKADKLDDVAFENLNLPFEKDEFEKLFKASRDAEGRSMPSQYDLDEPFVVVKNGKSILDMPDSGFEMQTRHGKSFKDGTRSGSLNKQFSTAFNTERDAVGMRTFINDGDAANPTYKFDKAKLVDPISTMQRSLDRITSSIFMDDYKLYAIEHWMREAEPFLTKINRDLARSAPFFVFKSAENASAFASATENSVIQNLLSNRFKINQFVGIPSKIETSIDSARQLLLDAAYNIPKVGKGDVDIPAFTRQAVVNIPLWMINHTTDPVTAMRTIVSHEKLGLFNPIQYLVQAQTFTNIFSIAPTQAMSGTLATFLHMAASIKSDPKFIRHLDNLATKMHIPGMNGWKPGQFMEANQILGRTGFFNVADEYADLHKTMKADYIGNDAKTALDAGLFFFKKGEQTGRVGAGYTAYKEFREAFPNKVIDRDDIGVILKRADLLTSNMSRASNSGLNQGVFSLPTQFLTFALRQTELFAGERLSYNIKGEYSNTAKQMARGRLLLFNSLLYGSPVGVGVTGLALTESIRKEALQRGYVIGENWYSTIAMEGLPSWFIGNMTGTFPNIGARFGAPGLTQFRDALKSDRTWYQILGGAAGTSLANTLGSLSPYWRKVQSMLEPDNEKKEWPLKSEDFLGHFSEVSVVNQGIKMYKGMNYGKWVAKNGQEMTDVSKAEAFWFGITGTQPQKQDDAYLKSSIRRDEIAAQKVALKDFIKEYHRYLDAAKNKDPENAKEFFKRADAILELGGFPIDKRASAIQIAVKRYKGQIADTDFDFAIKNVPPSRKDFMGIPMPFETQTKIPATRREQFRTEQKLQDK